MEKSEEKIVEKIISLFHELAEDRGIIKSFHHGWKFDFEISGKKYMCQTEREVFYRLPNEKTLTHKSDIMITNSESFVEPYVLNPAHRFVSIEVKHKSSVTDQFKSRSYDMLHMRTTYPNCLGIMMYIRIGNITPEQAKKICYPFHHFFSCSPNELSIEKVSPLFREIISFLKEN